MATGYWVSAAQVRLGTHHGALIGVRVTRGGEPVLEARRIDLEYDARDLLPGSSHRFGLRAVTIDAPHFTLIHRANGTYNVSISRAAGGPSAATPNPVPVNLTVRVRNASATLIDQFRYYEASRRQSADHIDIDAQIDSVSRTSYRITGFLEDGGPQPFRMAGTVDNARGYALHHVSVRAIPISTISNYFINSPAAHVLAGTVRRMDLRIWAFGIQPNQPVSYHMAGAGDLAGGNMLVRGLDAPISALSGRITIFDSGFASSRLTARVGHLPIVCAGGIFDFRNPQFRIGVRGAGRLQQLHEIMRIANGLPIGGALRINALIEGSIDDPVLMVGFHGARWNYGAVPLADPNGTVALLHGQLVVLPFHVSYGALKVHVQGNLQLGRQVHSVLALHAVGPSSSIPYLGALVPEQTILAETLLHGDDLKVDSSGYLVSLTHPRDVHALFTLNRYGVGEFGPMELRTPQGGSLVAGFAMDRRSGASAFWASARNLSLRQPSPIDLPGVAIPELPPIEAHIETADVAGEGSARNVVVGGNVRMAPAIVAGVPFSSVSAHFAGPLAESDLSSVRAAGPWGTFDGSGAFGSNVIAARGNYRGTLQGLHMFFGTLPAQGSISGPMAIAIAQGTIFVQAQHAQLGDANIHGIPVSSMSGTMSFARNVLRVYSAQAHAAGGTVDLAGTYATAPGAQATHLALVTGSLQAGALHGLGVPLTRGSLRAAGSIAPGAAIPQLDAGVAVDGGALLGYGPLQSSADVRITGSALQIRDALASLGATSAVVRGGIGNLTGRAPAYDILADVPVGSIERAAQLAGVQTYSATGSFSGTLHVTGSGTLPRIAGRIGIPVGSINGLGFRDASAVIDAGSGTATAREASVTVGSTIVGFSASTGKNRLSLAMDSRHADLSDFNDYFDTGDTLAGTGSFDVAFTHFNRLTLTSGDVDVRGLRYKRFPIGNTDASWAGLRNVVQGRLQVGGDHGMLAASGTIDVAPAADLGSILTGSRYDVGGSLRNFDLSTWLPALGFAQLPITGRIDGDGRVRGGYPHLVLALNGSVRDGTLGPLPIQTAELSARSSGDRIDVTHLVFALPSLQANGSGSFGLRPTSRIDVRLHAVTSDLPSLIARVSKKHLDVRGRFESTMSIGGTMRAPTFSAGVEGTDVNAFGIAIPSFVGQVRLHRRDLVLRNAEFAFAHGTATLAGALPLQLSPFAFGPADAPIALDLTADGVDLSTFEAFLGNGTKLGGSLSGHIGIGGTVSNPQILGELTAQGGSYVSALETTPITRTVAQLSFSGERATLDRLQARLGSGTLSATGSLSFGGLNGGPLGYALSLQTRGAQLSSPVFGSASFDSNLHVSRADGELARVTGGVSIGTAAIPLSAFLQFGGAKAAGPATGPPLNLGFDVAVSAGKNVRVRGGGAGLFGLDIGGQGAVHLAGTLLHPSLQGRFESSGGTLTYIDHAFKIQQGEVTFDPATGVLPDIYAIATTHVFNPDPDAARNPTGYADITATVTGTVPNVKVAFQSDPPGYSDQQIIALLLPLGGLVGPIQFTQSGGVVLPSAPVGSVAQGGVLPNVFEQRANGTVTVGQEAFNILNTQFASGILSPIETALGNSLGLSDVNLTVAYGGGVGLNVRRLLGSNVYALYGTTFTVPQRQTFGVAYQPNAFTSAQFTMFVQQFETPFLSSPAATLSTNARASAGQALQGQNGFTFLFVRLF